MASPETKFDKLIEHILLNKSQKGARGFTCQDARDICRTVQPIFEAEPSLLELPPPIKICGDIHGQLLDLLRVFELGGLPPESKYLFLGDYVDRGPKSVEVILLLFALKIKYPESIYLIRGNHESMEMTETFGFADECKKKLNEQLWFRFLKVFDYLPIGAVVADEFFCIHGGLSPELNSLDDVRAIERPTDIPEEGLVADLLWSDPCKSTVEFGPNDRGNTITWGRKVATKFLSDNHLTCVVRGHQMAQRGFHFPFEPCQNTITVFTASNYANGFKNKAAFMDISTDLMVTFHVLPDKIPQINLGGKGENPPEPAPAGKARPPTARKARPAKK